MQAKKRDLNGTQPFWHLDLGFPTLEYRENKFLLFSYPTQGIQLGQPQQTNTQGDPSQKFIKSGYLETGFSKMTQ